MGGAQNHHLGVLLRWDAIFRVVCAAEVGGAFVSGAIFSPPVAGACSGGKLDRGMTDKKDTFTATLT